MPDDTGDKTETPTPRRRQEARKKGQVPRSQDLSATVTMLAGLIAIELVGPGIWKSLLAVMRTSLGGDGVIGRGSLVPFASDVAVETFRVFAPFLLVIFAAAIVVMYAQVGLLLTWTPLTPSLSKLNPLSGLRRICSARKLVETGLNLAKTGLVGGVAYLTICQRWAEIVNAAAMDHVLLYVMSADLVFRLAIRLAIVMFLLALLDYAYQRYRHEKDLRMTKEEVKEELRRMEGDPVIKRRRRQVQLQLALQRLQSTVPRSDVVVTNPTHYAVALAYAPEKMNAPKVTAKGADYVAFRIRQIAAGAGIPIVERKELARGLYDAVPVGHEIPEKFYQAVAEILAYVYELTGRRFARGAAPVAGSGTVPSPRAVQESLASAAEIS